MKLHLTLAVAGLVLALPAGAAPVQTVGPPMVPSVAQYQTYIAPGIATPQLPPSRAGMQAQLWRVRILKLRNEGLALQNEDGGQLTPEHRAMLQAKLDRINAQLRRD